MHTPFNQKGDPQTAEGFWSGGIEYRGSSWEDFRGLHSRAEVQLSVRGGSLRIQLCLMEKPPPSKLGGGGNR